MICIAGDVDSQERLTGERTAILRHKARAAPSLLLFFPSSAFRRTILWDSKLVNTFFLYLNQYIFSKVSRLFALFRKSTGLIIAAELIASSTPSIPNGN